uniref:Uncharacterized protein n=1 Tax=Plectus sambesii TaxID=2011161 RepID=A0A914W1R3_9BILA
MHFYTFAAVLVHVCFLTFAVSAVEPGEPDVGILRFGRSDFESELPGMMFGKRELPGMMFGKRGVEDMGMMFGKRELPGMMFGKRDVEDMSMMFGKRDLPGMMFGKRELPGMMFGKRDVEDMGLMFGKRPDKVPVANADELYRTMFRTMHGKRDMTMQEMQGTMFGKRLEEPLQPDISADQLAQLASAASLGEKDQVESKSAEKST